MKTSTKLIIVLMVCIPVSLLAYNLNLRSEYQKGNFNRDLYPMYNIYTSKTGLKPFKHIVINGSLKLDTSGSFEVWRAHVWIGSRNPDEKNKDMVTVNESLKDNLGAIVKNDTLFISFHVTSRFDNPARTWNQENGGDIVKIYSNRVESITSNYANITIQNNPGRADSLKLTAEDWSSYNLQNLKLQKLTVSAKDSSWFNITSNNSIGKLKYALQSKGLLNVEENPVAQYIAERIDSAARIQITGKATILQKQLSVTR